MPKELKSDVKVKLNNTVKELFGIDNFTDMICDETIATENEEVVAFIKGKNHPALTMEAIM
jgi:acetyl-CoA synthase